jgi:aerobic carbon-monoxide dehydrogenase large subunit
VRGQATFVDDLAPPGCLFLCFTRSAHAGGVITRLDAEPARRSADAILTLTGAEVAALGRTSVNPLVPGLCAHPAPLLAQDRVLCLGQPVAAVVAQDRWTAMDLAESIGLEIAPDPPGPREALRQSWSQGDVPAAMARADHVIAVSVQHALLAPMALEPRAALAHWDEARQVLNVWLPTQTPHRARLDLARILRLSPDQVRVIAPHVGGSFGGKASLYPEDAVVALAAIRTGRPVKWTATRSEDFLSATAGRGGRMSARLGVMADGMFVALDVEGAFPLGGWMPFSGAVPARNAGRILPGPYRIPHVDITVSAALTGHAPVGIYRGAGRPEATLLMERLVDEAARTINMDPVVLRLRNVHARTSLPSATAAGEIIDASDFPGLIRALRRRAGLSRLRREVARLRALGRLAGLGVALYAEPCGQGWESAAISLDPSGAILVATGSTSQGQGRETAAAQIAAGALGCAEARLRVVHGDTALTPEGIGALASRSTPIGGSAIVKAARIFLRKARALAATTLQAEPRSLVRNAAGWVSRTGAARLSWEALAKEAHASGVRNRGLMTEVRYEAKGEAWASGAVVATVSIDADTGVPTVGQIVWIDDAGVVINPVLLKGQLLGGLAQGLGEALMERLVHDPDGQLLTGSLMDYRVPRAADMPPSRIVSRSVPSRMNLLGAKGAGEAGCIGIPAAIVNAIHDALAPAGVSRIDMPCTAQTIWTALQAQARKGEAR